MPDKKMSDDDVALEIIALGGPPPKKKEDEEDYDPEESLGSAFDALQAGDREGFIASLSNFIEMRL